MFFQTKLSFLQISIDWICLLGLIHKNMSKGANVCRKRWKYGHYRWNWVIRNQYKLKRKKFGDIHLIYIIAVYGYGLLDTYKSVWFKQVNKQLLPSPQPAWPSWKDKVVCQRPLSGQQCCCPRLPGMTWTALDCLARLWPPCYALNCLATRRTRNLPSRSAPSEMRRPRLPHHALG